MFFKKKAILMRIVAAVAGAGSIGGAVGAVVSCADYGSNYDYWGTYQLITDAGSIADKSFNNATWDGLRAWANDPALNVNNDTFGFTQPSQPTTALLQKAYETAIYNGAKYLILPGFTHGAYGVGYINKVLNNYPDVRAVGIDTDNDYSQPSHDRVVHAKYYTSESGYLAALSIAVFANSPKSNNGFTLKGSTIKVATFGGQPYSSVTSYMDGLLEGMTAFNKYVDGTLTDIPYAQADWPELPAGQKPAKFELYYNKSALSGLKPHFTESFESGVATPLATDYIQNDVQFISAVAGPQTGDAVGAIQSSGQKGQVYVIGVDTEQSELYGADYVLGSEMKGLARTTEDILSKAADGTSNFDKYIKEQDTSPQNATWFGLKNGIETDPSRMFTGFAFNAKLRPAFSTNAFINKFDARATNRDGPDATGSIFVCTDGFGSFASEANVKSLYDASKATGIAGDCGLSPEFKIGDWKEPTA